MKFTAVIFSAILAATALAAPAPSPAENCMFPLFTWKLNIRLIITAIDLLRRSADAAISAAEAYSRALAIRDGAVGAALKGTEGEDDVNVFCSSNKNSAKKAVRVDLPFPIEW